MKKIICLLSVLFLCFSSFTDTIYKEFIINGNKVGRWVEIYYYDFFDSNGNIMLSVWGSYKKVYEYDSNGNLIYTLNSDGEEEWYEYDNNKIIHEKNSSGKE